MESETFDRVTRSVAASATRRGVTLGFAAGIAAALLRRDGAMAKPPNRQGSCRRRGKHAALVCHNGKPKCVHRRNIEAHLQHGDPLGDCSVEPGPQTCSGATLPCNPNLTSCGDGCFCFVTTTGGSFCAGNGTFECIAGGACAVDQDCVDRLGEGYVCVSTAGCGDDIPGCTNTSNACAGPCQQG